MDYFNRQKERASILGYTLLEIPANKPHIFQIQDTPTGQPVYNAQMLIRIEGWIDGVQHVVD